MTRDRASFSRRALALVARVIAPHVPMVLVATAVIIVSLGHPTRSAAGSTIKVANTNYDLHTNCSQSCSVTLGLQNGINQVWGPFTYSFGGSLPSNLKTLVISYRYNCDSTYQICGDKEEYYVTQRYGLVQWIHYIRIPANGTYAQLQKTVFNKLIVGVVTPDFPCF